MRCSTRPAITVNILINLQAHQILGVIETAVKYLIDVMWLAGWKAMPTACQVHSRFFSASSSSVQGSCHDCHTCLYLIRRSCLLHAGVFSNQLGNPKRNVHRFGIADACVCAERHPGTLNYGLFLHTYEMYEYVVYKIFACTQRSCDHSLKWR